MAAITAPTPAGVDPGELSWCEVDADALGHNVRELRRRVGDGVLLAPVVKSDAYGHGLALAARAFVDAGADWLVTNSLPEAEALRAAGVAAPLYVCGNVPAAHAARAVAADVRLVVYDRDVLAALAAAGRAAGRPVPVHVKVETGNHRQGLPLAEALALGCEAQALDGVVLEGLSTHYADIEDTTDHRFAMGQLGRFDEASEAFRAAGIAPRIRHTANSAAAILWGKTHEELVRVGIASYGLWPSGETYAVAVALANRNDPEGRGGFLPELRPALSWRARVVQVKDVPVGGFVGYGRTFRATYPMRIAILPVGYYEGYDRRLSNVAHVLLHGVRAPIRGRICMNMAMVDVTHVPGVVAGDVATLLGQDGEERVSAEDLAGWMGSINYEVVSRIHPSIPRVRVAARASASRPR
ncbi:MAG: alanine racemase [Deltaproteobacteria bacterium]|nr:alanine racemase [Deltaproteobacteria bacterium]